MDRIAYQEAPAPFCSLRVHTKGFSVRCDSLSSCTSGRMFVILYSLYGWLFVSRNSDPWRKEGRAVQTSDFPRYRKGHVPGKYSQMLQFRDGYQPVSHDGLIWLTAPNGLSFVSPLPSSIEKP